MPASLITQVLTLLGAAPTSTNPPPAFDTLADALLGALPNNVVEQNTFRTQANALATQANIDAQSAATSAALAQAIFGATMFNAGTAYAQGQGAVSAVNFQVYRRKTAGSSATDPSADTVNWAPAVARRTTLDISTAVTLAEGVIYRATGACSPLMPAAPVNGMVISIMKSGAFLVTCMRNGSNMNGIADDRFLGTQNQIYTWMYIDVTTGWLLVTGIY